MGHRCWSHMTSPDAFTVSQVRPSQDLRSSKHGLTDGLSLAASPFPLEDELVKQVRFRSRGL